MRDALVQDLSELPGISLTTTCDVRCTPAQYGLAQTIQESDDIWQIWEQCIQQADAVWVIAPETAGILARLTAMVELHQKKLLGCSQTAVKLTSDKRLTNRVLQQAGLPTLPTYTFAEWQELQHEVINSGWVVKMVDGAGCEDSGYFQDESSLRDWIQSRSLTHIIQSYQSGVPASISALCKDGQAWLLSCNQQKVELVTSSPVDAFYATASFRYEGSIINGLSAYWVLFESVAQRIAKALPELAGYVGIDLILGEDSGAVHLLEINPRLTTSYAGLRAAINYNPAQLVLDLLLYNDEFVMPVIARNKVEVSLHA